MTKRTFRISRTGEMDIHLGKVRYIGIENIADLKTYNMSRMGNRVMHIMEFNDGGSCEVTYLVAGPNAGKLEVFRTNKARVSLEASGAIVGQSRRSSKPQI
jgi:hypothetical protein